MASDIYSFVNKHVPPSGTFVFAGDLNETRSGLDRSSATNAAPRKDCLIDAFLRDTPQAAIDLFREQNPTERMYTWSRNGSSSRIDYIIVPKSPTDPGATKWHTEVILTGERSDHDAVLARLEAGPAW